MSIRDDAWGNKMVWRGMKQWGEMGRLCPGPSRIKTGDLEHCKTQILTTKPLEISSISNK